MGDLRIQRVLGTTQLNTALIAAAYADSTWDKIVTTLNVFIKFEVYKKQNYDCRQIQLLLVISFTGQILREIWPQAQLLLTYISNLKLVHNLRNLDASACENMLCKTQTRGAKNLMFYKDSNSNHKKVMTLPLLKNFGQEIAQTSGLNCQKALFSQLQLLGFSAVFSVW